MEPKKTILIGSDQLTSLSQILKFLKKSPDYNYISTTDSADVLSMINIISPTLVVLSFEDNERMLQEIKPIVETDKIPVLCLSNQQEEFCWSKYSIVFAHNLEQTLRKNRLSQLINSILLLKSHSQSRDSQTNLFSEQTDKNRLECETPGYELELEHKVKVLKKVKSLIKDLYQEVDDPVKNRLLSIANLIKVSVSDEKHWEDFKLQFNNSHKGFLKSLNTRHPNLTNRDLKYCCYLRIGMSNEDIRHILGINQESVSTHKYRLKRKLHLSKSQDLRVYIDRLAV